MYYNTDRCDREPGYCDIYRLLRICKDNPPGVEECCKSCPLQARPITPPPILREDNVMLNIPMGRPPMVQDNGEIEVCCEATSISGSAENAVLARPLDCPVQAECELLI